MPSEEKTTDELEQWARECERVVRYECLVDPLRRLPVVIVRTPPGSRRFLEEFRGDTLREALLAAKAWVESTIVPVTSARAREERRAR